MFRKHSIQKKKLNLIGEHIGKNIYTYIGKYGPCIQYGEHGDDPKYVSITKDDYPDIKNIKLDEAIKLLKYPLDIGKYDSSQIQLKKGPHGFYIQHNTTKISVDNDIISLEDAIAKIKEKKNNIIKEFKGLKILNGPYGPYINKGNQNVSISKNNT